MACNSDPGSVVEALCDVMNAKDHKALGELFAQDAEFVSVNGARLHGRDAIATAHSQVFSNALSDSHISLISIETMVLTEDIVVCHAEWSRFGISSAALETVATATGVFTLVLRKTGIDWNIVAATNVQNAIASPRIAIR